MLIFSLLFTTGCDRFVQRTVEVTRFVELHCPRLQNFSDLDFSDPIFYVLPPLETIAELDYANENLKHLRDVKSEALFAVTSKGYDALASMTDSMIRFQSEVTLALTQQLACVDTFNQRARKQNEKSNKDEHESIGR